MFSITKSLTTDLSLDEVVSRLSRQPQVEAALLLGSVSTETLTPASDYDVLVVLDRMPAPLWLLTTQVNHRFAEFYFVDKGQIDKLVSNTLVDYGSLDAVILVWLRTGKVVVDHSGFITRIREKLNSIENVAQNPTEEDLYSIWFRVNYDLLQTKRILTADDPVYQTTVDIRLLYTLHQVWMWYFTVRGLHLAGEKAEIRYLLEHDPEFLGLFQKCAAESDRQQKVALYQQLAVITLVPIGGLWPENVTALQPKEPFELNQVDQGLKFWDELVGQ